MDNYFENDDVLMDNEGIIEITLLNKPTGVTFPKVPVYGTNTLDQVIKEYAGDIGISLKSSKLIFENKRTGAQTSDSNALIESLELQNGDVLAVSDDGCVA